MLRVLIAMAITGTAFAQTNDAIYPHEEMNNWGTWGADDEIGAMNYITPEVIAAAASEIKTGKTFSLAVPIGEPGPLFPTRNPPHHFMVSTGTDSIRVGAGPDAAAFTDDYIYMPLQGSTQWDALPHVHYGGFFYNGVPLEAVTSNGAQKLGIENVKTGFVGRGVLIDIPRYKGHALEPGYGITRADVEGALKKQGTQVREGDIVIIRTGEVPRFYNTAPEDRGGWWANHAGIAKDVIPWIRDMKIAAMAADNLGLEQVPNPDGMNFNLHNNILRDLGVYIGEIWWLEELAEDCANDGRYSFFLAAQPLHIPGAVGSPINPIAVK